MQRRVFNVREGEGEGEGVGLGVPILNRYGRLMGCPADVRDCQVSPYPMANIRFRYVSHTRPECAANLPRLAAVGRAR